MPFDERAFRKAMGCFATGVTVVTTVDAQGMPVGVTVNSFTSVSLDPPLVLFCLDKKTRSLDAFRDGAFGINILREDQKEVSIAFASREGNKWHDVAYTTSARGTPVLDHCVAHFECAVQQVVDGGDHLIFIGKVEDLEAQAGGQPLLYYRGAYAKLRDGA